MKKTLRDRVIEVLGDDWEKRLEVEEKVGGVNIKIKRMLYSSELRELIRKFYAVYIRERSGQVAVRII